MSAILPVTAHDEYLRWYYHTGVWKRVTYRGVRSLKCVSDMWNYQEIIHAHNIDWVIETGSRFGGSALYFADLLVARGAGGRVISIDMDAQSNFAIEHPKIDFLYGDSASADILDAVKRLLGERDQGGRVFLILDSDHRKEHVLRELEAYVPLLAPGDYLVVEDTCINGHPVRPDFGPGPWEAVEAFVAAHPGTLLHDAEREGKFGMTFAPHGHYIRL